MSIVTQTFSASENGVCSFSYDSITNVLLSFSIDNNIKGSSTLRISIPIVGDTLVVNTPGTNKNFNVSGIILRQFTNSHGQPSLGWPGGVVIELIN